MHIHKPYLLFLGDATDQLAAKTAAGVAHWRPDDCLGQLRLAGCQADLGLPDMSIKEAVTHGVRTLIVGVANRGGVINEHWQTSLLAALDAGLDIASGLHNRLSDVPVLAERAGQLGRQLLDVRHPTETLPIGNGVRRPGKRLLTVGTDCSVGKMYTSLALEQAMQARGMKATFRATGQTGILIVGSGISVDAVVADFISGAVEWLAPANESDHWDVIEGQGSLFHASFAGVSMGLLHGAQADALVMCHEPTRPHMRGLPDYPLPGLAECIAVNEQHARLTNPEARCIGISINTAALDDAVAERLLKQTADDLGLPCVDAVRTGVEPLMDQLS